MDPRANSAETNMEYWDSYYAKYPYYGPPSYPPSYPGPVPPSEISVCGATHMRCALSDSDSDSSSTPTQKQDVYTSATKYAAISSSQSTPESRLKKTNGTESSLAEVQYNLCLLFICSCIYLVWRATPFT